ncbi:MAG: S8 family serine peptidase, partial [Dokdonella sp.]
IIGSAIDDVTAAGVSYFSSAGNNIGINAYQSALRIVPNGSGTTAATNTALAGTNIDLTGVPANLYAGGFHNFNPAVGQLDVAQLVNYPSSVSSSQGTEMQWDDPYDQRDLVLNDPPIFSSGGTINGTTTSVTFGPTSSPALPVFTQGQPYVIKETATSGNFDGIVQIFDASNTLIVSQDTGTDEVVQFYPPTSGQYHITIVPFSTTTGDFTLTVNTAQGTAGVTTDLNLLAFRVDTGAYISSVSLTSNNLANNRPVELGTIASPAGQTQMQFLIARANVPTASQLPTRVRWTVRGNGGSGFGPAEYFTYNTVTTKGHATAKGCNGTAAYSMFRPNTPEYYTSPGPATILFDADSNRLPVPDVREVPRIAAADQGNTSFFSSDSSSDLDTKPNFGGTSAAAPHAAAIAALVLQSRGGPGSVTPAELRTILQQNTFPHDLDPMQATGTATSTDGGTVSLTIRSDEETNKKTGANDPESMTLTYTGTGSIASITFNPAGTATTAGNVTGGNHGVQDTTPGVVTYFENDFPGLVFEPASTAFTLGSLVGLTAGDIQAPSSITPFTGFSNLAGTPSNGTSHFWTMTIGFTPGAFSAGKVMHFTVGRGAQHSAVTGSGSVVGNGTTSVNALADLFGGGVFLPRGTVVTDGMTFTGTTTSGGTFSGKIRNNIGAGYSPLDGYGFIDAAAATDRIFANGFE